MITIGFDANAQTKPLDISMINTAYNIDYSISKIANIKYPPKNLFDGKLNSCWVSNYKNNSTKSIYIRIPKMYSDSIYLSIFSGYAKSKSLYKMNSRPKTIKISFYSAFIPDGYYYENGYLCKAFKLPEQQVFILSDAFEIQHLHLKYTNDDYKYYSNKCLKNYYLKHGKLNDTIKLIKLEIDDIREGDKYPNDICISEMFFNNCYISIVNKLDNFKIKNIYVNKQEDALYINENNKSIQVYKDNESVLQIIQQSNNNNWAIINALPREAYGRVETTYLIFDLLKMEVINTNLDKILPNYYPGESVFLSEKNGKIFLDKESALSGEKKVELKHYFY